MDILRVKPFAIAVGIALVAAPLVFWLFFYCLARFSSVDLRNAMPWLKALRWVTWILSMALAGAAVVVDPIHLHYLAPYGFALFSFSAGLSIPQGWLKKRLGLESDAS
jgi:hypothetical protein